MVLEVLRSFLGDAQSIGERLLSRDGGVHPFVKDYGLTPQSLMRRLSASCLCDGFANDGTAR